MCVCVCVCVRGLLLFVTVNGHLTLALKSFTGQVERERGSRREGGREGGSRREAHSRQEGQRRGEREQPEQRMDGWSEGCGCVCVCVRACMRWRVFEKWGGRERGMCAAGLVKDDNSPLSLLERPAGPSGVRCQPLQPGLTVRVCVCAGTHACIYMRLCVCVCTRVCVSVCVCVGAVVSHSF